MTIDVPEPLRHRRIEIQRLNAYIAVRGHLVKQITLTCSEDPDDVIDRLSYFHSGTDQCIRVLGDLTVAAEVVRFLLPDIREDEFEHLSPSLNISNATTDICLSVFSQQTLIELERRYTNAEGFLASIIPTATKIDVNKAAIELVFIPEHTDRCFTEVDVRLLVHIGNCIDYFRLLRRQTFMDLSRCNQSQESVHDPLDRIVKTQVNPLAVTCQDFRLSTDDHFTERMEDCIPLRIPQMAAVREYD